MFSFSCLMRSVLIEHIANAWGDLLVLLIVFCKIDKLTLLNIKLIYYSNQNKLFSVHFQEMPGFKGKRNWIFTKKTFRYRLPVSPPRKRTKTSSSTPNLKSPSIRTSSLLKKSLSISKYVYPFKWVSTPIRRNLFTKDDGNFTADLQNVSFMSLDESIGKIEVDPKEEASVVEVFQDDLDKLSDVGKKDKLLKFFKLYEMEKSLWITLHLSVFGHCRMVWQRWITSIEIFAINSNFFG